MLFDSSSQSKTRIYEYDLIEFLSSILCIADVKQNEKLIESLNAPVNAPIMCVV